MNWPTILLPNRNVSSRVAMQIMTAWMLLLVVVATANVSQALPTPLQVLYALPGMITSGELLPALWSSLLLNIQAICLLVVFSLAIAYLSVIPALNPVARLLSLGRFNGFVGIPLIFTLLIGNAHWVKVALLVFGAGVFTIPSLVQIVQSIPESEFDHARTLKFGEVRAVYEVLILGRRAEFIDAIRTNCAMVWMLVPMVEALFRYEGGIGALMIDFNKHMQLEMVYAVTIVVLGVGFVQDYVIGLIRDVVCPYATQEHSK